MVHCPYKSKYINNHAVNMTVQKLNGNQNLTQNLPYNVL